VEAGTCNENEMFEYFCLKMAKQLVGNYVNYENTILASVMA